MTIAAGFRCLDGIVLCADTEHTVGETLKLSRAKIFRIPQSRSNEKYALVIAGAGDSDFVNMTVQKIGRGLEIRTNPVLQDIHEVVEETVLEVYGRHIHLDPTEPRYKPVVDLLIAVWTPSAMDFFKTSSTAVSRVARYDCIGTGTTLASYLCETLLYDALPLKYGLLLAIHLLKQTKKYAPYCGGESNIAILQDNGEASVFTTADILDKELWVETFEAAVCPLRYESADVEISDHQWQEALGKFSEKINAFRSMEKEFEKFRGAKHHPRYKDAKPLVSALMSTLLRYVEFAPKSEPKEIDGKKDNNTT